MTNWISTKDDLPPEDAKVIAKNPFSECISWIEGVNEMGKPQWMHEKGWKHADDFVTHWRWMTEDEMQVYF